MASPYFLNALLLLQFSVVLANIATPPASAPVPVDNHLSPPPPPIHPLPPSQPPVEPPQNHPFPRFKVAVQGVVYCKSCKYIGVDTLMEAAPLIGAVVKLRCGYIKETAKTDDNGYFFFMPPDLTLFGLQKCKVFLVSSPLRTCSVATNLHDGARGATPVPFSKTYQPWPLVLSNVGPFAFEPSRRFRCHH